MLQLANRILSLGTANKKGIHKHTYKTGFYNDYNYRPGDYKLINGSVCTNYLEYYGIIFGKFICPIEGFNSDETHCCGPIRFLNRCCLFSNRLFLKSNFSHCREQYCCGSVVAEESKQITSFIILIIISASITCILAGTIVIIYFIFCKHRNFQKVVTYNF